MTKKAIGLTLLVLLALPSSTWAYWWWFREAINTALLHAINGSQHAATIEQERTDAAQIDTYNRYRFFFANNASFRAIRATIAQVHGIRSEIAAIACGWQFSSRTALLRDVYLRPVRYCRPSFRRIWGSPARTASSDLEELHDFVGSLTANQLSSRAEAEATWTRVYPEVFRWTTTPGWSPAESNRVEAMMLAMSGQVAIANNQVLAQTVLLDELARDAERTKERQAAHLNRFTLDSLATLNGTNPRPLP